MTSAGTAPHHVWCDVLGADNVLEVRFTCFLLRSFIGGFVDHQHHDGWTRCIEVLAHVRLLRVCIRLHDNNTAAKRNQIKGACTCIRELMGSHRSNGTPVGNAIRILFKIFNYSFNNLVLTPVNTFSLIELHSVVSATPNDFSSLGRFRIMLQRI